MTIDSWRSPEAIKAWWATPSQSALRRPYTAEEVAALRDVFPEASHSNELALKLRGIFEKHRQNKTINIAMSVLDAVSLQMMAEEGFGEFRVLTRLKSRDGVCLGRTHLDDRHADQRPWYRLGESTMGTLG
jgi:isocitrate lyase